MASAVKPKIGVVSIRTRRRIISDFKDISRKPLHDEGIFVSFNGDDLMNFYFLIIGPAGTPYQNGFYLFKGTFPDTYPLEPIKITFLTTDGKVRFNPNLYANGKVCLSMINTWHGPGWTPSNTVRSVLISILAHIFIDYPMANEPGYESMSRKSRIIEYNKYVMYNNFKVAIQDMLICPCECPNLKKIMYSYFHKNIVWYRSTLERLMTNTIYENKRAHAIHWNKSVMISFMYVFGMVNSYYEDFILPLMEESFEEIPFESIETFDDERFFLIPYQEYLEEVKLKKAKKTKQIEDYQKYVINTSFDNEGHLIKEQLLCLTKNNLINMCRIYKIKGYSKFKKGELVDYIMTHASSMSPLV